MRISRPSAGTKFGARVDARYPELHIEIMERLAAEKGVTVAALLRRAVRDFLMNEAPGTPGASCLCAEVEDPELLADLVRVLQKN